MDLSTLASLIVIFFLRIVERERGNCGAQHIHGQGMPGALRSRLMIAASSLRSSARRSAVRSARGEWEVCQTRADSRFLRRSIGPPIRGYRCRDRPKRPDRRRCSRSWKSWQPRPQVPWAHEYWSRSTWLSRFDSQDFALLNRARGTRRMQPFFIPETVSTFQVHGIRGASV